MSYSFYAKGATKADALADAIAKMEAVVSQQPLHILDRPAHLANLAAQLSLVKEASADEHVEISMHGSISAFPGDEIVTAGVGCSVTVSRRVVS